jgi:hypothetical protein
LGYALYSLLCPSRQFAGGVRGCEGRLDEASRRGWTVVDIKRDREVIGPFEMAIDNVLWGGAGRL